MKKFKKFISILLAVAVALAVMPVVSSAGEVPAAIAEQGAAEPAPEIAVAAVAEPVPEIVVADEIISAPDPMEAVEGADMGTPIARAATAGDLSITLNTGGDPDPTDYEYDLQTHTLTILSDTPMSISMAPGKTETNTDHIVVGRPGGPSVNANITLDGVKIDVSGDINACAFEILAGCGADITLSGDNELRSGANRAGLEVPKNARLEITDNSTGKLLALSKGNGAGIGGGYGGAGGTITISGGTVTAMSSQGGYGYGAGIGGGANGGSGTIRLEGYCAIIASGGNSAPGSASGCQGGGAGIGGGVDGGVPVGCSIFVGPNVTLTATGGDGGKFEASSFYAGGGAAVGGGGGSVTSSSSAQGGKVLGSLAIYTGSTRPGFTLTPGTGGQSAGGAKKAGNGARIGAGGDAYGYLSAGQNGADGAATNVIKPSVISVLPSGVSEPLTGDIVITFNDCMNTAAGVGSVSLTGGSGSVDSSGTWSDGDKKYTARYSGLAHSTGYTVNISGFQDSAVGNEMDAVTGHTFTTATPPSITTQPSPQTVTAGQNASFTVAASGNPASFTYQWQENTGSGWTNISNGGVYSGAASATLSLTGVTVNMNGNEYRCVVSNTIIPDVTSNAALLTVNVPPSISGPTSMSLTEGYAAAQSDVFTVTNGLPTATTVALSNDTSGGKITWNGADKKLYIAAGLTAGSYGVTLTPSNAALSGTPLDFTLTVKLAPAVTPGLNPGDKDETLNPNQQFALDLSGIFDETDNPVDHYEYSTDGGLTWTNTTKDFSYTPPAPGAHEIIFRAADSTGAYSTSYPVIVTVTAPPPPPPPATTYSFTFNYMDGVTKDKTLAVNAGSLVQKPDGPVREGYIFEGWYKDKDYKAGEWDFAKDKVNGNTAIYAKWTEKPVPVESVSVEPKELTLAIGGSVQLSATVLPENATNKNVNWVIWEGNLHKATVDGHGVVTGLSYGRVAVTAKSAENEAILAKCVVSVKPYINELIVPTETVVIEKGQQLTMADIGVSVVTKDGSQFNVKPKSADKMIVFAYPNQGIIWGRRLGETVITVKANGINTVSKEIKVIVVPAGQANINTQAVTDIVIDPGVILPDGEIEVVETVVVEEDVVVVE